MAFSKPIIAVTTGDPGGIGPEVIVKALADRTVRSRAHFRIYGPGSSLEVAARRASVEPFWVRLPAGSAISETALSLDCINIDYPFDAPPSAHATAEGGELSFRLVEDVIVDARRAAHHERHISAIVTGPINKFAWQLAGHGQFPGHTELLAMRTGAKCHGMMFVTPRLRVILATTHVPLMEVRGALSIKRICDVIELGRAACEQLGISKPRIAVCGLNPHAGEAGMLGEDEHRTIEPAIRVSADAGIDVRGPFPGDTVFNAAVGGAFDLVVAMYHDQGLIPVKLLDRDRAVNMTVGLPIIRTSPDHGTAFDIAGQNRADAGSMTSAIELAIELCKHRRAPA